MTQQFHEFKTSLEIVNRLRIRCQRELGEGCGFADSQTDDENLWLDGEQLNTVWCVAKVCYFDNTVMNDEYVETIQ
jgi:hypothetical protein